MLVSAPLMVAQLGAQELRKKMITGNLDILKTLRLSSHSTLGQLFSQLASAPPLSILALCNKEAADSIMRNMLQHSQDLDYVQDVLTTVGSHTQLNPSKFAVLEAFNRRRNFGQFKQGHHSIVLDRARFAHMASPHDNDTLVRNSSQNHTGNNKASLAICHFFQRETGCQSMERCKFTHKCIICASRYHGASDCKTRKRGRDEKTNRSKHPPTYSNRRARAYST